MISATWTTPCEIAGKLSLTRDPFRFGLGYYEDTEGKQWDIHSIWCIGGVKWVNARLVAAHPNYYGTHMGSSCVGLHEWKPYEVEAPHA
jgi:hypothetical protein